MEEKLKKIIVTAAAAVVGVVVWSLFYSAKKGETE